MALALPPCSNQNSSRPDGRPVPGPGSLLLLVAALLISPAPRAEVPVASGSGVVSTAAGHETATWRYTVRPGDSLPQIAEDLLKPGRNWPDLLHFNKLRSSSAAVPGTSLDIPLNWLRQQPQPARVQAVSGSVLRRSQLHNRMAPLQEKDVLNVGDRVQTLEGRVTIQLADGTILRLEPDSLLVFDRMTRFGKTGMADTRLRLERGSIRTQVEPLADDGSIFRITTPSAVAAVRGTAFRLTTEAGGTRLEVTEGRVAFGADADPDSQTVEAGYGAQLQPGKDVQLASLPEPPRLAPIPESVAKLPVRIQWQGPENARAYRLDLYDSDTGQWLDSRRTDTLEQRLGDLDNGNYSLELAAISADGLLGVPATAEFSIGLEARAARLDGPASGSRIAPEEFPEFQWSFTGSGEIARVELARRADFSHIIANTDWTKDNRALLNRELTPGEYYWRVATRAGGSSAATSEVRSLVVGDLVDGPEIINVSYVDNDVRIFWQNQPNSQGYQLQLAADPGFTRIITEAEVEETTAALRLARGKRYFVRLRGMTGGALDSSWGHGRELYVE